MRHGWSGPSAEGRPISARSRAGSCVASGPPARHPPIRSHRRAAPRTAPLPGRRFRGRAPPSHQPRGQSPRDRDARRRADRPRPARVRRRGRPRSRSRSRRRTRSAARRGRRRQSESARPAQVACCPSMSPACGIIPGTVPDHCREHRPVNAGAVSSLRIVPVAVLVAELQGKNRSNTASALQLAFFQIVTAFPKESRVAVVTVAACNGRRAARARRSASSDSWSEGYVSRPRGLVALRVGCRDLQHLRPLRQSSAAPRAEGSAAPAGGQGAGRRSTGPGRSGPGVSRQRTERPPGVGFPKRRHPRSDRIPLSTPPASTQRRPRRDSSPKRQHPRSDRIPLSTPPASTQRRPRRIRARSGESREATESHSLSPSPRAPNAARGGFEPEAARAAKRPNPTLYAAREHPTPPAGGDSSPKRREPRSDRIPLSTPPASTQRRPRGGFEPEAARAAKRPNPTLSVSASTERRPRGEFDPEAARAAKRPNPTLSAAREHRTPPAGGIRARSGESREATESHSLRHYEPRGRVVAERVSTDFRFPATSDIVPPSPAQKHSRNRLSRTCHLLSSVDFRCHPENNW